MGKVPAFRKAHAENGIARLQQSQINRDVGLRARVRLHIDMFGSVDLLCTFDGDPLDFVNILASAVIARPGIALCVLVGQMAAHGFHDCLADKVFRCDQLDVIPLPLQLSHHRLVDFRIVVPNMIIVHWRLPPCIFIKFTVLYLFRLFFTIGQFERNITPDDRWLLFGA